MQIKPILKFKAALFILAVVFFLSSCSSAISLKSGDGGSLIDEKNNRSYIDCSLSLRAVSIKTDVYAKGSRNDRVTLYEIVGLDPAEWLSEDITAGIPLVFREQTAVPVEPTIEDFDSVIYLTQTEVLTLQIGIIEDKDVILGYISELLTNEEATLPSHDNLDFNYTLNFASDKYPGLYYLVQYYADTSGKFYLYDRGMKKCVISNTELPQTD